MQIRLPEKICPTCIWLLLQQSPAVQARIRRGRWDGRWERGRKLRRRGRTQPEACCLASAEQNSWLNCVFPAFHTIAFTDVHYAELSS